MVWLWSSNPRFTRCFVPIAIRRSHCVKLIDKRYHPIQQQALVVAGEVVSVQPSPCYYVSVMTFRIYTLLVMLNIHVFCSHAWASAVDEDQLGAWYMLFLSKDFAQSRFGVQGDLQYRSWDSGEDLEQLLVRGGLTYRPTTLPGKVTLGVANITSGAFGQSNDTKTETRLYQEALIPQKLGDRVYLNHRMRFEQRWVNGQDRRTRLRYALFANLPLNKPELSRGAWYLAFYNELFVNGQKGIGDGREVDYYDRNRTYGALGYKFSHNGQIQAGYMQQHSRTVNKGQFQLSVHLSF